MGGDLLISEQVALFYYQNKVQYFSIPTSVIHNRDPRFTSDFCKSLWKLLESCAIAMSPHHPKANGQIECMNCTITQIFNAHMLDENQEHWPDYAAITEMAINSTIDVSIQKTTFEVLYIENTPLPVDLFLSKESSINLQACNFDHKRHQLVNKIKSAIHDA